MTKGAVRERIAALSTARKLMLGAGVLLVVDLFLTWQQVPLDYGPKTHVTSGLDGWDLFGLLVGLLTLALIAVVVLRESEVELSPDVPWSRITLGLGIAIFLVVVVKNLTDEGSTWESYLGVALAALVALGAFLGRSEADEEEEPSEPEPTRWHETVPKRRERPAVEPPEPRSEGQTQKW